MTQDLTLRITDRRYIAESIVLLDLRHPEGSDLPAFTAGSHLRIRLPGGLVRAYSLCNDPGERSRYQIAVQLDPASRGGSRAVHESLHAGDTVQVSGPHNQFALDEAAAHTLLLAGGIGITPLMAMARRLEHRGVSWELHYSTRTPERCAFSKELTQGALAARSHLYFDNALAPHRMNLSQILASPLPGAHLYVCGPSGFMDAATARAAALGWLANRVHTERFSSDTPASDVRSSKPFTLVLLRSALTLHVPEDRSVLDVVRDAGVDLPASCEQGICGTCITDVLAGRPDHRDQCLDESMRSTCFTPCCSRSLDDTLTIDL